MRESDAIVFAMRAATLSLEDWFVQEVTFGRIHKGRPMLSAAVRQRTERELDAIASHELRRQAEVLTRVLDDDRVQHLKGSALVSYSRAAGVHIDWTPTIDSPEQLIDYGLLLLLDDSQPWGRKFFRCHLERCRRFFLAAGPKGKGQFRYKYCSPEHQREADAIKAADRVRRFHERRRSQKS